MKLVLMVMMLKVMIMMMTMLMLMMTVRIKMIKMMTKIKLTCFVRGVSDIPDIRSVTASDGRIVPPVMMTMMMLMMMMMMMMMRGGGGNYEFCGKVVLFTSNVQMKAGLLKRYKQVKADGWGQKEEKIQKQEMCDMAKQAAMIDQSTDFGQQ